jgi:hypothetical protein
MLQSATTCELLLDDETQAVSAEISCNEEITITAISYDPCNGQYLPLCSAIEYDGTTVVLPVILAQGDHSLVFVGTMLDGFGIALEGNNLDKITSLILSDEPVVRQRAPVPDELLAIPNPSSIYYLDDTTWFWDDVSFYLDDGSSVHSTHYLDDTTWFWDDTNIYLDQQ